MIQIDMEVMTRWEVNEDREIDGIDPFEVYKVTRIDPVGGGSRRVDNVLRLIPLAHIQGEAGDIHLIPVTELVEVIRMREAAK